MTSRKVAGTPANRAASIRARLLNLAKATGDDFNLVLVRFALERFLFRLSTSRHADSLILKGALLFTLWLWNALLKKNGIAARSLHEVVEILRKRLGPTITAAHGASPPAPTAA